MLENKFKIIIKNSVLCLVCKEEIVSTHVHDFVTCRCGNISVDGGTEYLKRSGTLENYQDTSQEVKYSIDEEIYNAYVKADNKRKDCCAKAHSNAEYAELRKVCDKARDAYYVARTVAASKITQSFREKK